MKKLLLLPLLIFMLSCSSDDDKTHIYEFYIINTDNIPCFEEAIRKEYSDRPKDEVQWEVDGYTKPIVKEIKESEVTKVQKAANEEAAYFTKDTDCHIEYGYRKVE